MLNTKCYLPCKFHLLLSDYENYSIIYYKRYFQNCEKQRLEINNVV